MDIIRRAKKKSVVVCFILLAFNTFFIISLLEASADGASESFEAKIIEEELSREKRVENKSVVSGLFNEAKAGYEAKDYEAAKKLFEKVVRIDPKNKSARRYVELCDNAIDKEMPQTVSGSLVKRGKASYNKKQYAEAISDFNAALVSNPSDAEAQEWLARSQAEFAETRQAGDLKSGKAAAIENKKELIRERDTAKAEKDAAEQAMLLDVDKGWLPPKKLPAEEMQVEEIISPEELADKEAKKKLEEKMASIVVPALSVTDADVQDLIRQLMELTGVTIVVDEAKVYELTKDKPIKLSLITAGPMPLLDILNIAFRTTSLSYKVEANYVLVSTKDEINKEELVTRTYRLKYGVRQTRKVELDKLE
jgi:tetratricopeptide (TPR) repeat protein